MNIVLVLIEPPLPFGNAASRWFYVLIKELNARGHKLRTLVACSKEEEIDKTREIFSVDEHDIRFYLFPRNRTLRDRIKSVLYPHSFKFSEQMKIDLQSELAKGFDILHIEQLWAGWLGLDFPMKALINVHHLQSIDLERTWPKSAKEWWNFQQIFLTEKRLVRKYQYIRSCSPRLIEKMNRWNKQALIKTVPVGIDSSLYEFIAEDKRVDSKTISLIGNMGWYPGQSAAFRMLDKLWPEIKVRVPEAKLNIVGWSARSVLKKYLNLPDVQIYENVPQIKPYFEMTNVMLYAPSRGSGMKIKILEAMGFGIPIVTTSEGCEGLPAEDGVHMGICEDDSGLIQRTVALLNDIGLQNQMRTNARKLLEGHCGPTVTVDQIEEIYESMLNAK